MPGWFETQISITAPATNPGCEPISPQITGFLTYIEYDAGGAPIGSGPLPGMTIIVKHNSTVLDSVITQAAGDYTLPTDTYIVDAGALTLTATFAGSGVYPSAQTTTPITITYCSSSEDLPARFWVSKWRAPGGIETDVYGAILCIDPNGLRSDNKGPVIFVLDDINFSPGLTEKSGVMRGLINDNATEDTHPEGRVDMELLKEGTIWIQDDDEFWLGVQRGPDAGGNEPHGAWDPTGGDDGEGAGRKWLMGGYINKRYYVYRARELTAILIGKDFMDVWKDQIFGTPLIPRNYTVGTDLTRIAEDVLEDVNTFQPLGWRYTAHPTYFPQIKPLLLDCPYFSTALIVADSSGLTTGPAFIWDDVSPGEIVTITSFGIGPGNTTQVNFTPFIQEVAGYLVANNAKITQTIGIEWKKEFNQEASFSTMVDICDESGYEWQIDYQRRVMLYARTFPPWAPAIRFGTNIRGAPEIIMGDTTERITHAIVTESAISSIPVDVDAWCLTPALWPDIYNTNRTYSASSMPPPPNPILAAYADSSLVYDDEGHPALCFQKDYSSGILGIHLSLFRNASASTAFSSLQLDLRQWRKIIFKFRHVTRALVDGGTLYRIMLHTELNKFFRYDFGTGIGGAFNQQGEGLTSYDTIDDAGYTRIELVLPELDALGNILELYDWVESIAPSDPDPTEINWVSLTVRPAEPNPGGVVGRQLTMPASAGDRYVQVDNWRYYAGLDPGTSGEYMFWQPTIAILGTEEVRIRRSGDNLDGTHNIELDAPILTGKAIGIRLSPKAGWVMSLSQFRFERDLRYETDPASPIPPYRYRMMVAREMENLNEAQARADGIIAQEETTMVSVKVNVDGDPRFEIGYNPSLYLGVDPFDAVDMFIDDITYILGADLDFRLSLLLGLHSRRPRELTEHTILDTHDQQLRNLGLGGKMMRARGGK